MRMRHLGALATLALFGCASVSVTKVTPNNTACMDGFRYYLPRPYVVLKQAAPIAGDQFIIAGRINEAGNIVVKAADIPEDLQYHFPGARRPVISGEPGAPRETTAADDYVIFPSEATISRVPGRMQPSSEEDETEAKSSAVVGSSGDIDPAGDVVDFSDTLAITYLPDFDEQYSIKYSAGLGRITTGPNGLRLRHGWMLDNISLDIDNTKLGEFIFNQIDKFTGVAATALTKQPPGTGFTPSSAEAAQRAGVTLRINYVVMAQKGIYPLLKPCERDNYLRMCEEAPRGPEDRGRVRGRDWVFLPYPPFTVIAFSVKREVSIEVLTVNTRTIVAEFQPSSTRGRPDTREIELRGWIREHAAPDLDNVVFSYEESTTALRVKVPNITPEQQARIRVKLVNAMEVDPPSIGKRGVNVIP
jgi:hypothetical protein